MKSILSIAAALLLVACSAPSARAADEAAIPGKPALPNGGPGDFPPVPAALDQGMAYSMGASIGIAYSQNQRDVVSGFSTVTGKWTTQQIEPPAKDALVPELSQHIALLRVEQRIYAYSGQTGRWDVLHVPEGRKPEVVHTQDLIVVKDGHAVYTFADSTGRWSSPDDGAAALAPRAGPTLPSRQPAEKVPVPPVAEPLKVFSLQYIDAQAAASILSELYGRNAFAVAADERNNALIVRGAEAKLAEVEALLLRLDEKPTGDAAPKSSPAQPNRPNDAESHAAKYRELEKRAAQTAVEHQKLRAKQVGPDPQVKALRDRLRQQVSAAFEARQRWQNAELVQLRGRLAAIDQSLSARERIKDTIIDRRVEELLDPDLQWEPTREQKNGLEESLRSMTFDKIEQRGLGARDKPPADQLNEEVRPEGTNAGTKTDTEADATLKQSLQPFQGRWQFESISRDGLGPQEKAPPYQELWVEFRQFVFSFRHGRAPFTGTVKSLDAGKTPAHLDLEMQYPDPSESETGMRTFLLPAIYKFEGDRLIIAEGAEGKVDPVHRTVNFKRPQSFAPSNDVYVMVWKRATDGKDAAQGLKSTDQSKPETLKTLSPASVAHPRALTVQNLARLMLAMHGYHDVHKQFPPATILGKDGKGTVPHSWRVELLPFLDQQALYDQYRFDEPWDGEHNKTLLEKMPDVFRSPWDKPGSTSTSYFGVIAQDMCFWQATRGRPMGDITDGTSSTIALVEAKRDVPWTRPEDILGDETKPLPQFGGWFAEGFHAGFADGSVKLVLADNDEQTIRRLLTINDDMPVAPRVMDSTLKDDPLEFRFLPAAESDRKADLGDDELARYRKQLAQGQFSRPGTGDAYCWREIDASVRDVPFTDELNDRRYVLTSFLDDTLLWPELQGHVRASAGEALPDGSPSLKLKFDAPVAEKLRRLTHANLHQRLAILVHGKVVVAPLVRSELSDEAMITGTFSQEELERLLKALSPAAGSPTDSGVAVPKRP